MSLTITIDRTEQGRFRAEVGAHPRVVIEGEDLTCVVEELKQRLDLIAVSADGSLSLVEAKSSVDPSDTEARAAVEKDALRNEELDDLMTRYPIPSDWGKEPGWADAL